jgi:hypothetical protein
VLINNLPPGASANDYRKYQHEVDIHNDVVKEFHGHTGPFVGTRHDRAIAEARPVIWTDLRRETAQDIREVNTAILKQLPEKQVLPELQQGPLSLNGDYGHHYSEEGASS